MSELVEVVGRVAKGRLDLHVDEIRALNQGVKRWEGKTVRITVRPARRTRTDAQNRTLWGVVYPPLVEHTGFTAEELHEWAKQTFLPKSLALADGNGVVVDARVVGGSTTQLNTFEFGEFVAKIRAFALDRLGVVIPEPNEQV